MGLTLKLLPLTDVQPANEPLSKPFAKIRSLPAAVGEAVNVALGVKVAVGMKVHVAVAVKVGVFVIVDVAEGPEVGVYVAVVV